MQAAWCQSNSLEGSACGPKPYTGSCLLPCIHPCCPLAAPSSCTQLQLPLKSEFVPGHLHQGARRVLWSPVRAVVPNEQEQTVLCLLVRGVSQHRVVLRHSHDGACPSALVSSPCCRTSQALGWREVPEMVHPPLGGTVPLRAVRGWSLFWQILVSVPAVIETKRSSGFLRNIKNRSLKLTGVR